ncbi:nitroreductase family protein [Youngiibacter multivorans]|nr:nitroreductase family protein [Youngiibacter multivorans]
MDVHAAINSRRSTRRFKPDKVSKSLILKVFDAGRLAPTARNMQSLKFVAITEQAMKERLRPHLNGQNYALEAPALMVICSVDNCRVMKCGEPAGTIDAAIALSFMMLRAEELGLSTCWMGNFDADGVRIALGAPETVKVVAISPLGYSDERHSLRMRKNLSEFVSFNGYYTE